MTLREVRVVVDSWHQLVVTANKVRFVVLGAMACRQHRSGWDAQQADEPQKANVSRSHGAKLLMREHFLKRRDLPPWVNSISLALTQSLFNSSTRAHPSATTPERVC